MRHAMTWAVAAMLLLHSSAATAQTASSSVSAALPDGGAAQSGRLIVFAARAEPGAAPASEVDTSPFRPTATAVAGRDVEGMQPGQAVTIDTDHGAFPSAFSALPAGTYRFQAVLDRNRDYNYGGRGPGDMVSAVVEARLPGPVPVLRLTTTIPDADPQAALARVPEARRAAVAAAYARTIAVDFVSPSLSRFWGRPVHMRGWIALPPNYQAEGRATWPVVYTTGGFGSDLASARMTAARAAERMAAGAYPPMIWVALDESSPTGTHEFADSVNNGPWGEALTGELIPWLERRYRMDAQANGRFLTGHSSGGWATLWLQTRYPTTFGGTWSTAPDPSDFHDFTGIDIYRPNANAYTDAAGRPIPLVRDQGRVLANVRDFVRLEAALGSYGGQFASFEWVFSPRGPDGRPMQLFDRTTGAIDPQIAAYWRDNYDIAHRMARDWPRVGHNLTGKIHVIVGTADTFYLDGSARRLEAVLARLGARAQFTYVVDRTHFNLLQAGEDRNAGMADIVRAMYAVARPGGAARR